MRLDVVAGPGTQGLSMVPPGLACEAAAVALGQDAVPLVAEGALTAASLLNVEAAMLVAASLNAAQADGHPLPVAPPEAAPAPLSPMSLATGPLASESPSPALAPGQGLALGTEALHWRVRAEAAEAAAAGWGDRLAQAEGRWAAERENLKHNHTMMQRAAADQGLAQVRRAQRQASAAFGLALAALLLGMPAAWMGGSQGALSAAEPKVADASAVQAARDQGHQQVIDALSAQASAAVVAQDAAKARALWAVVADLAQGPEDREAAQAALKALPAVPDGALPKAQVPPHTVPAPAAAAAAALGHSPSLGRLLLVEEGKPARVRVPLRRALAPAPLAPVAQPPAASEALHDRIPDGVRAKF